MSDHQVDRLITRLERTARIASTMHRISHSRLADADAVELRAQAATLTNTAHDAITLLRTLDPDDLSTPTDR